MISEKRLKFWLDNDLNVLFSGRHGVGKSSIIKQVMDGEGVRWKYFSAATMDPWVDFIGVPREKKEGDHSYLELVRPREFADDDVEAIVIDEFNRSHKKVRNAVMELIQFKSINGHRFENLRVVWAIINPARDDAFRYDVQPLDPAQRDRFQVHVEIPYRADREYFADKFGAQTAAAAVEWWENLPDKTKRKVSPRRLDYALEIQQMGGSLRDALPRQANPRSLLDRLDIGSVDVRLKSLYQRGTDDEIRQFFEVENQYRSAIDVVLDDADYLTRFLPHLPEEKLASLIAESKAVLREAVRLEEEHEDIGYVIDDIMATGTCEATTQVEIWERRSAKEVDDRLVYRDDDVVLIDIDDGWVMPDEEFNDGDPSKSPDELLETMANRHRSSTRDRRLALSTLVEECPMPAELDDGELATCLQVVNTFLERSLARTVHRFARKTDLAGFVNALLLDAVERNSLEVESLLRDHLDQVMSLDHGLVGLCTITEEARQ